MTTLKALLVDNEQGQLTNFEPAIRRLLGALGYGCDITPVLMQTDGPPSVTKPLPEKMLTESVERLNREIAKRPDVVFVDNHMASPTAHNPALAAWGFLWIASVKAQHPDTVFVLITRESLTNNEFGKAVPHPDIILSKQRPIKGNDKVYDQFFLDSFGARHKRTKIHNIVMDDNLRRAFAGLRSRGRRRTPLTEVDLGSLLEQVCYMGREGAENLLDAVFLERLEGGLSGAVTCAIALAQNGKPYQVVGVVKISNRDSALKEIQNHGRYVKWMLPYTWRVDVIGTGETGEFGAVCYSFAHGGHHDKPVSLATVVKKKGVSQIVEILSAVFDPQRQSWYEQNRTLGEDLGASLSKALPYFISNDDLVHKSDQLRDLITTTCKNNGINAHRSSGTCLIPLSDVMVELQNLEEKIFSERWDIPTTECICHGDLNAGNIMVRTSTSDFSFIDFRHTGWHHRARDFCSIEASLRTLFPMSGSDFKDYLIRERVTLAEEASIALRAEQARSRPDFLKEFIDELKAKIEKNSNERDLISLVRFLFLLNFPDATFQEYCLAQLVHAWWLICFEETWSRAQLEMLVAEVLALIIQVRGDRVGN